MVLEPSNETQVDFLEIFTDALETLLKKLKEKGISPEQVRNSIEGTEFSSSQFPFLDLTERDFELIKKCTKKLNSLLEETQEVQETTEKPKKEEQKAETKQEKTKEPENNEKEEVPLGTLAGLGKIGIDIGFNIDGKPEIFGIENIPSPITLSTTENRAR